MYSSQEMYKAATLFWTTLRIELLSASSFLTGEKPNSSQLWRLYWASHQVSEPLDYCYLITYVLFFVSFYVCRTMFIVLLSFCYLFIQFYVAFL